jgi:hypothetical protein
MLSFLLTMQGELPFFIAVELQAAAVSTWLTNTFAASTLAQLAVTDGTALPPHKLLLLPLTALEGIGL